MEKIRKMTFDNSKMFCYLLLMLLNVANLSRCAKLEETNVEKQSPPAPICNLNNTQSSAKSLNQISPISTNILHSNTLPKKPTDLNIDPVEVKNKIMEMISILSDLDVEFDTRSGAVKGLLNLATQKAPGYNVMVYNMKQQFEEQLRGKAAFINITHPYYFQDVHGIWIFKCGWFLNKGKRDWNQWNFGSNHFKFKNGSGVIFLHPECDEPAYRPNNHYLLAEKDFTQPDVKLFYDVDSPQECITWTIKHGFKLAVYQHETKQCHVKNVNKKVAGLSLYESGGVKIGSYYTSFFDVDQTKDNAIRQEWYNTNRCDVVTSLKDGRHYCKIFPYNPGFTMVLARMDDLYT